MQLVIRFNLTAPNFQIFTSRLLKEEHVSLHSMHPQVAFVFPAFLQLLFTLLMVKQLKAQQHSHPEQHTFMQFYNTSTVFPTILEIPNFFLHLYNIVALCFDKYHTFCLFCLIKLVLLDLVPVINHYNHYYYEICRIGLHHGS